MALLNINAFKKEGSAEKQAVPDELPSLPSEKKPEMSSQAQTPSQSQQQASQGGTTVPEELPPIFREQEQSLRATSTVLPSIEEAKLSQKQYTSFPPTSQLRTDEKLYFSELIAKFHDQSMQKEAEKEMLDSFSGDVLSKLNSQWEEQKQKNDVADFDRKIIETMQPLQILEQEWRALRKEIDQKTLILKEKEYEIKKAADELKRLLDEKKNIKPQ